MTEMVVRRIDAGVLDELEPLHADAFSGSLGVALGRTYRRRFLEGLLSAPGGLCIGGFIEDELVGYVLGAQPGVSDNAQRRMRGLIVASALRRPWILLHRTARRLVASRLRRRPPVRDRGASLDLVAIGVRSDRRGDGIGRRLIEHFTEEARSRGHVTIALSVHAENTPALRLYESAGWRLVPSDAASLRYEWSSRPDGS